MTGVTSDVGLDVTSKRLELLKEAVPGMSRFGILISSELTKGPVMEVIREAAHKFGISIVGPPLVPPINEVEYRRVFSELSLEHPDALLVIDQSEHFVNRQLIAVLGNEYRLPIMGPTRDYAEAGLLASYGVNNVEPFRIAATQIERYLTARSLGICPSNNQPKSSSCSTPRSRRRSA